MAGGDGNDIYVVDDAGDVVNECHRMGGTDRVDSRSPTRSAPISKI